MNASHNSTDRIVRTAAWFYVAPRAAKGIFILAIIGLAAFLVFIQLAIVILHRVGA